MKTVKCEDNARPPRNVMVCDYKHDPGAVLEIVDKQLEAHGMEIELFDMGDDQYYWRIVPPNR